MALEITNQTILDILAARRSSGSLPTTEIKYNCPVCEDRGYIFIGDKHLAAPTVRECECAVERRNLARIKKSGLESLIMRCSFETFNTDREWQKKAMEKAERYCTKEGKEHFFVMLGRSGSGKTHLCTAIVGRLIRRNFECRYFCWRKDATRLKQLISADVCAYEKEMARLREIPVLYIDDFLQGAVTDADLKLAFDIIDSRYEDRKRTIISSEMSMDDILNLSEAIGGRIYELSRSFIVNTQDGENYRLRMMRS